MYVKQLAYNVIKYKDKDKDSFIGPQEFVVGYSKVPEQPQSSTILTLWRTQGANQPPYALLHRSSPHYALRHGKQRICASYGLIYSWCGWFPPPATMPSNSVTQTH